MTFSAEWLRLRQLWSVVGVCVLVAVAADGEERPQGLSIRLAPGQVIVSGVPGGHPVIAFGIGIGRHGHAALLRRDVQTGADDDGNGSVDFSVRDLPSRSVWVAVDATSGAYVLATPSGELPGPLELPVDAWRGNHAFLDVATRWVEVLVVRPGVGAWTLRSADGGSNDADAVSDEKIRLRLDRMERLLGGDRGPDHALPKDIIVLVDPQTLNTFVSVAQ